MNPSYVIKEPKSISFSKVGITGKRFPSRELNNKAGFCLIETKTGHKTAIIEHMCDFLYYILRGKGYFEINKKKENCAAGDLVIIPHGSVFTYKGNLKMLLVTTPPFYPEQEETLLK